MSILLLALLYIVPLAFIICMVVLRDSLTLQQAGIFTTIFTIIPSIIKILQILGRFRTEGNQGIIALGNWFRRHKHENIAGLFSKNQYKLEHLFNASIIVCATLSFLSGQFMQLVATFIYP